jgi:quercetin dioxygenase-like cupin family protein
LLALNTNAIQLELNYMKMLKITFLLVTSLAYHSQAYALEQSASVKVSTVLKTETSWDGNPIVYPSGKAEITGMLVEIAPNSETGWHLHPVPSFGMVLEGELEVQLKNGTVKRLKSGEALAEAINTLHNGRSVGSVPVKLVVFYAGSVGKQLSEKENSH